MRHSYFAILTATGLLLSGCGSDKATEPEIPPGSTPVPTALEAVGSVPETGAAGSSLSDSLRVQLLDEKGGPLSGIAIEWNVVSGGGSLSTSTATTGANGEASVSWTLGTTAGENEARATLEGLAPVVFKALGVPGDPATVELLLRDGLAADSLSIGDIGESLQLGARVQDEHDNEIAAPVVSWSTSDTTVAVVDTAGLITARGAGSVRITASAGSASREVVILVLRKPAKVEITPDTLQLYAIGDTLRLSAAVRDRNGVLMPSFRVTWRSLDPEIATIDTNGLVTAEAEGTTTIEARLDTLSAKVPVVVTRAPGSISVAPDSAYLAEGDTVRFTATVRDRNAVLMPDARVTWRSLDPQVATVDTTGLVTAVAAGTTNIDAMINGLISRRPVVVVPPVPASILVTPDSARLGEGDTLRLSAIVRDRNRAVIPDAIINWLVADTATATVSPDGLVTAKREGPVQVTATIGDLGALASIQVMGKIAFREGTTGITIMNTDGTGSENSRALGHSLDWSPDGTRFVYHLFQTATSAQIYIRRPPDRFSVALTDGTARDENPSWSPDGSKIAFHSNRGDGQYRIYVMDADGSNPVALMDTTFSGDFDPMWSPDGSKLVFFNYQRLFTVNADGTGRQKLTNKTSSELNPVWSPDGSMIAFDASYSAGAIRRIYLVPADGSSDPVPITDESAHAYHPTWSPDGSQLAFHSQRAGDLFLQIYVMNADGTGVTRLTDGTKSSQGPVWRPRPKP
jgi:uncharacterized protein YjdB